MDLDNGKFADKYPLCIFHICILFHYELPIRGPDGPRDKRALGPSSSGSKDPGTHNAPLFPGGNFVLLQLRKILWIAERIGKLMRISNVLEGEACLVTKRVGRAHFRICL